MERQPNHLSPGWRLAPSWNGAAAASASVATGVLVASLLTRWLPQQSAALVLLVSVLATAAGFGIWSGVVAAGFSFLAYNFFFIEPLYTFTVADPQEVFALGVFLVVAVAAGSIAGRLREKTIEARNYAERVEALHQLSVTLSGAATIETIVTAVVAEMARAVSGKAVVLTRQGNDLELRAAFPPEIVLTEADRQAARRCMRRGETVSMPATGWEGAHFEFRVLATVRGPAGVVGLAPVASEERVAASAEPAVQAILRLASIALERTQLAAETAKAKAEATQEQLRSALLSSLSHDLRTPLATIMGAASSLRQLSAAMTPPEREDLLAAIEEESARLSRFVSNLLEMTRLESGPIDLMRDWLDISDTIRAATGRAERQFPRARIGITMQPGLPLIRGEAQGLEQVVLNLLDNAVRYAPGDGRIEIDTSGTADWVTIAVTDQGPGIPPEDQERVFDKFQRLRRDDRGEAGTGLGLAICRAIVTGMQGTIQMESPVSDGGGTRVVVRLPVPQQPSLEEVKP